MSNTTSRKNPRDTFEFFDPETETLDLICGESEDEEAFIERLREERRLHSRD